MKNERKELETLTRDGQLYHNRLLNDIESLIPNPFVSCHAADLLELPNGDLLCCWFAGSDEGNADISIVLSRLNAGSSAWTEPVIISDVNKNSEQNPSLFLNDNGDIWAMYTSQGSREELGGKRFNLQYTSTIKCKVSKDNGYTWGETKTLFDREGSFCRQKIQVLSNGRYIFGNWICFNDTSRNGTDITVMQISDDKGKTWRPVEVPNSRGRVHANIIEIDSGKLIALYRSRSADNIYISKSEDYGDTWSEPVRTELPNNNASISAIRLQSGRIAVVYNHFRANDDKDKTVWPFERCPVAVAVSEDNGETWPIRRIIENGEGYFGYANSSNNRRYEYPVIMQGKDGRIHVAYSYGDRICVKYVTFDEKWIIGDKLYVESDMEFLSFKKD
jgi:predicted neuraminidase